MRATPFLAAALCLVASAGPGLRPARAQSLPWTPRAFDREILWKIVSNCLEQDHGIAEYCSKCPAPLAPLLASCTDASGLDPVALCRKTTPVWDKTAEFVAFGDMKMCGCPDGFVHGLALPLSKVTGVEDPSRPAGIWGFAFDEAAKKIGDKAAIVLVVNSRSHRQQDQLHIHLLRLAEGARDRFMKLQPVRVESLADVWAAAARHAAAAGSAEGGYGVAVIQDGPNGGFLVATTPDSPEWLFGAYRCSGKGGK